MLVEKSTLTLAQVSIPPGKVKVAGVLGNRLESSSREWMLRVDEDTLVDCFRHKPGVQRFIGEHLGKFSLAAIPTAALVTDPDTSRQLTLKMERLIKGLIAAQEPEGYLGTYLPEERWMGCWPENPKPGLAWDVWTHKYCILALLEYHRITGSAPALQAACRAADCVIANVGPGKHDLNRSDEHLGLASGSILEPIVLLYRRTGEARYLAFAQYIVSQWEEEGPPALVRVLRQRGQICTIGRGKAYEMMSCFVGLLEYALVTENREYLDLLRDARDRIADTQRYPTGGASASEHFKLSGRFPEHADIETCATFSWIQFNLRLFALTNDRRALELVEEALWNQLLPAISPSGETWTYHLPITGPKKFFRTGLQGLGGQGKGPAVTCCHNNGQRALALLPQYIYTVSHKGELSVNLYCDSRAMVALPGGEVQILQESNPNELGDISLTIIPQASQEVRLQLRSPAWARSVKIDGRTVKPTDGRIDQVVGGRTIIRLQFEAAPRVLLLGGEARGKCALACGPIVMALDPVSGAQLDQIAVLLGSADPARGLSMKMENGWPVLEVPAVRLPDSCVAEATQDCVGDLGKITLRPVLCAGLKDNPSVTQILKLCDFNKLNPDNVPNTMFPEYRVALPYLWVPEIRR